MAPSPVVASHPPPPLGLGARVAAGTFWSATSQAVTVLLALGLTPFLYNRLGPERFGLWTLAFVSLNALSLFDLGLSQGLVRLAAQALARGDRPSLNGVASSGLALLGLIALGWIVVIAALSLPLLSLFRIPAELALTARWLLVGGVVVSGVSLFGGGLQALLTGAQRLDFVGRAGLLIALANAAGVILVVTLGYGLYGLLVNAACIQGLTAVVWWWGVRRVVPGLALARSEVQRRWARELLRFGWRVQLTQMGTWVTQQWNKLVAGGALGLAAAAAYDVGARASATALTAPLLILPAILPAASELDAQGNRSLLLELYRRTAKYVMLLVIPLALFLFMNADALIAAWLGAPNAAAALVVRGLAAAYGVNLLTTPGTLLVRGIGRPELETQYALLALALQVGLSLAVVGPWGLAGLLLASLVAMAVGSLYFLVRLTPVLGLPWPRLLVRVYLPPAFAALVSCGAGWLALGTQPLSLYADRGRGVPLLLLAGLVVSLAYLLLLWIMRYLGAEEWQLVRLIWAAVRQPGQNRGGVPGESPKPD